MVALPADGQEKGVALPAGGQEKGVDLLMVTLPAGGQEKEGVDHLIIATLQEGGLGRGAARLVTATIRIKICAFLSYLTLE